MTTGIFALIGVFLGAYMARVSSYSVWLHQRRSEIFATFLQKLDESINRAEEQTDRDRGNIANIFAVQSAFAPLINYSKIVRLHLPTHERERFSTLVNEIWTTYSNTSHREGDLDEVKAAIKNLYSKIDEIQEILEKCLELSMPQWLQWLR